MASLSPVEFNLGLLSALNLSLPTNQQKLRQILAKQADAKKLVQDAPRKLTAPPGLSTQPFLGDGIAAPPGLDCSKRSKAGNRNNKVLQWLEGVESDEERTSIGPASLSGSGCSDCEIEVEEFQLKADAPCFVPGLKADAPCFVPNFLSQTLSSETPCTQETMALRTPFRKVQSPHGAIGRPPPVAHKEQL